MDNNKATLELGTKPVGQLLMQYSIPAIIAMTAASLYNMVDRIFIGQGCGPMAISGLTVTFPFMNLSGAFGAAIGVGSSTLISVKLGQKDYKTAHNIFGNNITLNFIVSVIFAGTCLIFLDPILRLFGATEQTLPYAREYMEVILYGNIITHFYFGMNALLRSASKPKMAMAATIFTVILNAILDPLFIYGFRLGIRGAAYATILSQTLAMCWQFYIFSNKKEILHFKRGIYRLRWDLVKNIIAIGSSPFAMNACACLVVIFINNSLVKYGGNYAVGAYGIGNSIVFIFIMITMGLNQGMQPITGYNYGAKKYGRMMKVVKYSIIGATLCTTFGWFVAQVFPNACVRLFTHDENLAQIAVRGLRINALLLPIIGYQMVITNFFQSIGKAKVSIFLSLSRQMLVLIPSLIILPRFFGVDGVWASLPLSDFIAALIAAWCMAVYMRRFRKHMEEPCAQEHNYSYYTPRTGAAPRGMAPQAGATVYEDMEEEGK
jgi:putative MATE family efflux protein